MLILKIIAIIVWIIAGIISLVKGKITKFEFGLVWITLVFNLIVNLFE